ncbi:DUF4089 domain-containing protein [Neokomagataea tanensis]|uniref:DUF4089 domain-containing protein n=1 Tax=Neokomagataea tanensis TaxID=661191 RepID=A0A4Y6V5U5_9PROT|nr:MULTISPECIES: DUF4089 domain-containing protein [Neokomagataea]QDH25439.1 DUF4089 domain-containing protein [Neokomagataea tanensis]
MKIEQKNLPLFFSNIGLKVPDTYHSGIMENVHVLSNYASLIDSFNLSDHEEPASVYEPSQP